MAHLKKNKPSQKIKNDYELAPYLAEIKEFKQRKPVPLRLVDTGKPGLQGSKDSI